MGRGKVERPLGRVVTFREWAGRVCGRSDDEYLGGRTRVRGAGETIGSLPIQMWRIYQESLAYG